MNINSKSEYFPIIPGKFYDDNRGEIVDWAHHLNCEIEICNDDYDDGAVMLAMLGEFRDLMVWSNKWLNQEQIDSAMDDFDWLLNNWWIDLESFTLDPADNAYEADETIDLIKLYGITFEQLDESNESAVSDLYWYRFHGSRRMLIELGKCFDLDINAINARLNYIC